jgi:L-threonylcarbamoyladenylate synthase
MSDDMARIYDCSVDTDLLTGMRLARQAVGRGEVVVIPTDTVYGIAADAFNPDAVQRLLDAKGRGRDAPPPVLIPGQSTLDALADFVPDVVRRLVDEFWPGGLTVILVAQPSLVWDLGETRGTVALRMPANSYALDQLGESVDVFLDGGAAGGAASTIVDASRVTQAGGRVRIVREGAVTRAQIQQLIGDELEPVVAAPTEPEREPEQAPAPDQPEGPRGTASGAEPVDGSADPAAVRPAAEPTTDAGPTYPEFVEPAAAPAEASPTAAAPDDAAATEPPADPPAHPR